MSNAENAAPIIKKKNKLFLAIAWIIALCIAGAVVWVLYALTIVSNGFVWLWLAVVFAGAFALDYLTKE